MRLSGISELTVMAKNERESGDRKFYNLAVLQNGECGNISCSKDVFDLIKPGPPAVYSLEMTYNDQYKSMQFTRVLSAPPASEKK